MKNKKKNKVEFWKIFLFGAVILTIIDFILNPGGTLIREGKLILVAIVVGGVIAYFLNKK